MSLKDAPSGQSSSLADGDGSDDSTRKEEPPVIDRPTTTQKLWTCPRCRKNLPLEMSASHLEAHESGFFAREHTCAKCGAPFANEVFRDLHERKQHAYSRPIIRPISRKPFSMPKNPCRHCGLLIAVQRLPVHEQTHLKTSGYQCAKCGSFLSTKQYRDRHERTFHHFDRRVQRHEEKSEIHAQPVEQALDQPMEGSSVQSTSSSVPPVVQTELPRLPTPRVHQPTAPAGSKQTTLVDELREKAVGLYVDLNHYPPNLAKLLVDFWIREPSAELLVLRCDSSLVCLPPFRASACSLRMDRSLQKHAFAHVFVKTPEMVERVRKEASWQMEFAAFASKLLPALRLPSVLLVASPADRASVDVQALAAHRFFVFPHA